MHRTVRKESCVLEQEQQVESGPPPICLIITIQQPGSSSSSSRLRRWCERVYNMKGLLIFSSLVLLAWSKMLVISLTPPDVRLDAPGMLCYHWHLFVSPPVSLFVLLQSGLQYPNGLSNVNLLAITGDPVDNLGAFLLGESVLDLDGMEESRMKGTG